MNAQDSLSMESSFIQKVCFGLAKVLTRPRASLSWLFRGHLAKDKLFVEQMYWFTGTLPRRQLSEVLKGIEDVEVSLPRTFDRKMGTSVSVEEAGHLAAITKKINASKILEIGTYDGNTTLVLAANMASGGQVVTVDLPPDFTLEKRESLAYTNVDLNLTKRDHLGRQCRDHQLSERITQVFGDSAAIDWTKLGGPFDLIFIDGCHSEDYVRADSLNALKVLNPGGALVWHDYGMIRSVSKVVDEFATHADLKVYALEGTRLAIGFTDGHKHIIDRY